MANPITDLILGFQNLMAQVPEFVQPAIVALAGAVPFVEGEGAAAIGIIGGINPVIAAIAGAAGNFLCVAVLVLLVSRVRTAVTAGRGGREDAAEEVANSARGRKVRAAVERWGVPGASLLGPLLVPTQFTSMALVGLGVRKGRVLFWQAIAIVLWTTLITLVITGVINFSGI